MSNVSTIKAFIIDEFLPDVAADALAVDYDLLANGVIDSLGLLKLIAWIEDRFGVPIGDDDLDPDNFRSVAAVDRFIDAARIGPVVGA
ncbi:acyl carrier protein [Actinokineospora sp. HUAS TT18]|uniref:acyl carrier protein n=1 Tax=Actinokineospora sp. HUAS TT18 TaxID=3447451 RepID=UPI003F51E6BE